MWASSIRTSHDWHSLISSSSSFSPFWSFPIFSSCYSFFQNLHVVCTTGYLFLLMFLPGICLFVSISMVWGVFGSAGLKQWVLVICCGRFWVEIVKKECPNCEFSGFVNWVSVDLLLCFEHFWVIFIWLSYWVLGTINSAVTYFLCLFLLDGFLCRLVDLYLKRINGIHRGYRSWGSH